IWLKLYFGHRLRCCQVRVFAGNSSVGTAPVLRFAIRVSPNLSMLPLHRMVSQLRSALNDGAMPIHRRYIGYSRSGGIFQAFGNSLVTVYPHMWKPATISALMSTFRFSWRM